MLIISWQMSYTHPLLCQITSVIIEDIVYKKINPVTKAN